MKNWKWYDDIKSGVNRIDSEYVSGRYDDKPYKGGICYNDRMTSREYIEHLHIIRFYLNNLADEMGATVNTSLDYIETIINDALNADLTGDKVKLQYPVLKKCV